MPDIDTLSYWVERLKPLLENDAPTVVVMANRTGIEVGEMRVHSLEDPPSSAVSREKDEKDSSGATEAGPPTQRVLVSFRGRQADITGLGIDLEYINALPDELREELIMRRIFEEQSKAVVADEKKAIEKLPGSEPVVADEVQGGTVENALLGEEARYAGTSVIMGLGGGEIKVWGMLGKAEEGVLVIDTSSPPKSVMAFQKNGEED